MATAAHCLFCFESLTAKLEARKGLPLEVVEKSYETYQRANPSQDVDAPGQSNSKATSATTASPSTSVDPPIDASSAYPLFVTWNTGSTESTSLRGCIGTFAAIPLSEGLSSYALTSALEDTRFDPVAVDELPSLSCSVTLLTDFEECVNGPLDWELGVHGIRLSFTALGKGSLAGLPGMGTGRERRYSACFLPDVATEQGWDREQTIISAMQKAGWRGNTRNGQWREVKALQVTRFRGAKTTLAWKEYDSWRRWRSSMKGS